MEIPRHVEMKVRNAFGAVINENWDGVAEALKGLEPEEGAVALGLAVYACGYVVDDIYLNTAKSGDGAPSFEELRDLASGIVNVLAERGAGVIGEVEEVAMFLALAWERLRDDPEPDPDSLKGLDPRSVIYLAFMCGGYLLAVFRRDDQDEHWWEYLDRIWAHALVD